LFLEPGSGHQGSSGVGSEGKAMEKLGERAMSERFKRLCYLGMIFISGLISVYDNVLSVVYWPIVEENPMGVCLIDRGGLWLLVVVKSITTLIASGMSVIIVYKCSKFRVTIMAVFVAQLALFLYLNFYTDGHTNWYLFTNMFQYEGSPFKEVIEFYR
jgi:hypothetical protein